MAFVDALNAVIFICDILLSQRMCADYVTTLSVSRGLDILIASGQGRLQVGKPLLHDWCNKGRGMCYPVCGMVRIKEPLLLIDKSSLCGGSGFPFSLSEWSLTICLTPYNRR